MFITLGVINHTERLPENTEYLTHCNKIFIKTEPEDSRSEENQQAEKTEHSGESIKNKNNNKNSNSFFYYYIIQ